MKNKLTLTLFCFAFLTVFQVFATTKTADNPVGTEKLTVDVNLLNLEVVVMDKNNHLVTTLMKENFRVAICPGSSEVRWSKQRKKGPSLADCEILAPRVFDKQNVPPLRIIGLNDSSASTTNYFKKFSVPASLDLIKTFITRKSEDKYAIGEFSERLHWLVDWTENVPASEGKFDNVKPGGTSAIFDSVYLAAKKMKDVGDYTKIIFVATDGIDTVRFPLIDPESGDVCPEKKRMWGRSKTCQKVTAGDAVSALQDTNTILYVVDFSERYNFSDLANSLTAPLNTQNELGEIAEMSGGARLLVKNVDDANDAFKEIEERIGKMYLLGFYTKVKPGWYDIYLEVGEEKNGKFKANDYYTDHSFYRKRWHLKKTEKK